MAKGNKINPVRKSLISNGAKCPIRKTAEIIGKKWTILIVYNLLSGEKRFKDLEGSLSKICPKMLSERLKELEKLKLIERKIYPKRSLRIIYRLTPKGRSLYKIVGAIEKWGKKWSA